MFWSTESAQVVGIPILTGSGLEVICTGDSWSFSHWPSGALEWNISTPTKLWCEMKTTEYSPMSSACESSQRWRPSVSPFATFVAVAARQAVVMRTSNRHTIVLGSDWYSMELERTPTMNLRTNIIKEGMTKGFKCYDKGKWHHKKWAMHASLHMTTCSRNLQQLSSFTYIRLQIVLWK